MSNAPGATPTDSQDQGNPLAKLEPHVQAAAVLPAERSLAVQELVDTTEDQELGDMTPETAIALHQSLSGPLATVLQAMTRAEDEETRVGLAANVRDQLTATQRTLSKGIARLPLGEGIRRVIEWINSMNDTPNGAYLLTQVPLHSIFDLRVPAIVLGLMLHNSKEGLTNDHRLAVIEAITDNFTAEQYRELFSNIQNADLSEDGQVTPDIYLHILALQLLTEQLHPGGRDSKGERHAERMTTISSLAPGLEPEQIENIQKFGHATIMSPSLQTLFEGISDETITVLEAISHADRDLYDHFIKQMIQACTTYNVRYNENTPNFFGGNTGARALQALTKILFREEMQATPAIIRTATAAATSLALSAGMDAKKLPKLLEAPEVIETDTKADTKDPYADLSKELDSLLGLGNDEDEPSSDGQDGGEGNREEDEA